MYNKIVSMNIAELVVTSEPVVVCTVLGSCVSVCLFSKDEVAGGMTHYALPTCPVTSEDNPLRYGDTAIDSLVRQLCMLTGKSPKHFSAKIVGGANSLSTEKTYHKIGDANVAIARQRLADAGIRVVAEDVGGSVGRKVLFHIENGRLQSAFVGEGFTRPSADKAIRQPRPGQIKVPSFHPSEKDLSNEEWLEILNAASFKARAREEMSLAQPAQPLLQYNYRKGLVICIGSSTGGVEALTEVITRLPKTIPPVLVVQHIPGHFSGAFAERLNALCPFTVKEAVNGDVVRDNQVLIAPGGQQMKLIKKGGLMVVEVNDDPVFNLHKPSVDYLFNSVAAEVGRNAIGVILTGMGDDGAAGLLRLRQAGAMTLSQDERSSAVYGMPKAAWENGASQNQVHLEDIAKNIVELSRVKKAA